MPLGLYNIKAYSVLAANAAAISLHPVKTTVLGFLMIKL